MTDEAQPNTPEDQQPDTDTDTEVVAGVEAGEGATGETEQTETAEPTAAPGAADAEPVVDVEAEGDASDGDADAGLSADDAAAMAESLLAQVSAAVSDVNAGVDGEATGNTPQPGATAPPTGSEPMNLPSFDAALAPAMPVELDLLADVNLNVKIELGRTRLLVDDVLKLNEGAVVELDKLAGDPVDIYVNDRHVARGEVLVLNDNFCVRINEIVEPENRQVG